MRGMTRMCRSMRTPNLAPTFIKAANKRRAASRPRPAGRAANYAGRATGRGLTGWQSRPPPTAGTTCDSCVNRGMAISLVWFILVCIQNLASSWFGSTRVSDRIGRGESARLCSCLRDAPSAVSACGPGIAIVDKLPKPACR